MRGAAKFTPADFCRDRFCDWFRISRATRGPDVRYACKACATISRTKTCPLDRTALSNASGAS